MARRRPLDATPDVPDLRDRMYEPALIPLKREMEPDIPPEAILDQGSEGACTGFSLAAVINHLTTAGGQELRASPRMLYEMARKNDEWPGEDYDGSSLRGAIKGWKNNGVCTEDDWPYQRAAGYLTIQRAKEARKNTVGAYYRIRPIVSDFHAALNEVGIIAVTAHVHSGWNSPRKTIRFSKRRAGGHAFTIVGYNNRGFIVQNSWGPRWGDNGLATWTYEDWIHNMMDAWVVRLAIPTPQIFAAKPDAALLASQAANKTAKDGTPVTKPKVDRISIAGHFVHIDDGKFDDHGRYWSTDDDVKQTAELVGGSKKYDHVLFYAHGGLNSPEASARRILAMRDVFKKNRIYPFHVMYDTGLAEELKDLLVRKGRASSERVGGFADWTDRFLEGLLRRPGRLIWEEMKQDAHDAFTARGAGTKSLRHFLKNLRGISHKKQVHLVGHSTGGVLIGHLLKTLANEQAIISTCTLLAPACTVDLFKSHYIPAMNGKTKLKLGNVQIMNLTDHLERDDNVVKLYRKSLLYLVSNAFEPDRTQPILGMQKFSKELSHRKLTIRYSNGASGSYTRSKSHGGFDNDVTTMNGLLKTILKKKPARPFTTSDLRY